MRDWGRIIGLICSAIGGAIGITIFCFSTFITRAENQVETDHRQQETQYVRDDVHDLRVSLDKLNDKIDRILERLGDHRR